MRKWFKAGAPLLMALFIAMGILAGCSNKPEYKQYKNTFITVDGVEVFNTVFTVMAWEKSDKDWNEHYEKVQELVLKYHKLFDYYDEYEGVNNIMTINKQAGIKPVKVEQEIIDMIKQAKELYDATGQETNIAMGSVTEIWHKVREHNMPGDGDEIEEADMILPTQEELDADRKSVV